MSVSEEKLYLQFHGRIIDSLGIQMYQSPVAAVAELIANAWDADARTVAVELPDSLSGKPTIIVRDDGLGMTFEQCQKLYLNIGRNRRIDDETDKTPSDRPVLGRKGIGKFAGFGIAELLEVDTTSAETGERTVFHLDLIDLRGDKYIGTARKEVPVLLHEQENASRTEKAGTVIKLKNLTLRRTPSKSGFAASMARRFFINQTADEFKVTINDLPLPEDNALMGVEYDFPADYKESEKPAGLRITDGVGYEKIDEDEIRWRIKFTKDTIGTEELRGVSVFCGIKVAPFSARLERLKATEKRTVYGALKKMARIEALSEEQFTDLSNGILTAWEDGRLHELIQDVSSVETMDEGALLSLLAEAQVLSALHVAEAVKAKVEIIDGLYKRIAERDIENAVRDYIAENPWLLSPEWETFRKETSVKNLVDAAAKEAGLDRDGQWKKRVDLVMSSGRQLLIVEFMRPGLTVDRDHINRYQEYIDVLRSSIAANTELDFGSVSGLLVADKLDRKRGVDEILKRLAEADMKALEWEGLLLRAAAQWKEFLDILVSRAPDDDRLSTLRSREPSGKPNAADVTENTSE